MSSSKINLGKVAMTPKGEWNASTTYERLDVVSYLGSSYTVLKTCTGQIPVEGEFYSLLAGKGDKGEAFVLNGGVAGQLLKKKSEVQGDTEWVDPNDLLVTSFNGRKGAVAPAEGDYTPEMVGAAPADHDHGDVYYTKTMIDGFLQKKGNLNILDNWYFVDPIDQRHGEIVNSGVTYYSDIDLTTIAGTTSTPMVTDLRGGVNSRSIIINGTTYYVSLNDVVRGYVAANSVKYWIDRWTMDKDNDKTAGKVSITDSGIKITTESVSTTGKGIFMSQIIENGKSFLGQTMTASVLSSEGLMDYTFKVPATVDETGGILLVNIRKGLLDLEVRLLQTGMLTYQLSTIDPGEVTIKAVKLEIGDQQTLAHQNADGNLILNDLPPNKELELAKCQRYQFVPPRWFRIISTRSTGNNLDFFVPLPVSPRTDISGVDFSKIEMRNVDTDDVVTGFSFVFGSTTGNGLQLRLSKPAHGIKSCMIQFDNRYVFDFNL